MIPPPSLLRSNRIGVEKPSIANWPRGNDSSNLDSETTNISTFPCMRDFKASHLFPSEFIFK